MSKKLYVGNLDYNVVQEDLQDIFSQYGEVLDAVVINDRETGRSKGFGFVELADDEDANKAIEDLNGKEFSGRNLVVNEAKPRESRGGGGGGGRGRGGYGGGGGGRRY